MDAFPVFFFCINGRGGNFIPGRVPNHGFMGSSCAEGFD